MASAPQQASVKRTLQMLRDLVHELKLLIGGLFDAQITFWAHWTRLKRPGVFSHGKRSITKIFYKLFWTLIGCQDKSTTPLANRANRIFRIESHRWCGRSSRAIRVPYRF
jgi:hypothetical protein